MEIIIVATVTAFGSVLVALITRATKKVDATEKLALSAANIAMQSAASAAARLETIERQTSTNGTNKTLGELTELLYGDLQETKRDLATHQRRLDAHGIDPGPMRRF